jgi:hypothetical protein
MRRLVEVLLVAAIVLDATYWLLWFTRRDWIASETSRPYVEFENAFPVADLWLAAACLLALIHLSARRPGALFWLICAGGAGMYLFCMDLLYDLQNGIFADGAGGAVEAGIVTLTLAFSVVVLTWSWRHRGELLSGGGRVLEDSAGRPSSA